MNAILQILLDRLTQAVHAPTLVRPPNDPAGGLFAHRADFKVERVAGKADVPGHRHVFADVESFAGWVLKHMPDSASVEVLADTDKIVAINEQAWFRDQVSCVLAKHPDFVSWSGLFDRALKQKAMVEELSLRAHTLAQGEGVIGCIQRLDLAGATEANLVLNANMVYEVNARKTTLTTSKLPSTFTVTCPVYLTGPAVTLHVALRMDLDANLLPSFRLVPIDIEQRMLEAYQAEVQNLRGLLGPAYLVGAGTLKLEE